VEKIAISKFKAECLAILERVRRTGQSVSVTRFGQPVAEIHPPRPAARPEGWLGRYRSDGRIVGDIVSPATAEGEWEALRR
jgi:antitoxin (DNA-binding transcriptional repressor) of toxin-antitoxin stability system